MKENNMDFIAFDKNAFWQAIRDKNYTALKVNTVSAMLQDPTFQNGEADRVLDILKRDVPEIFENRVKLGYEKELPPDAWDRRYYTKLTYWFQENFSLDRVDYIKTVGKAVSGVAPSAAGPSPAAPAKTGREDKPTGNFPKARVVIAAAIALAIAAALLFILLPKRKDGLTRVIPNADPAMEISQNSVTTKLTTNTF